MKTFNVLEGKEPLSGSYFLEASAGTGKTFAIENIIPRLLLQSSSLSLEQILVVTFTRAATRELRSRIHKNLIHVLWDLEGREGKFPYLEEIRAQGKEALYQAKKKIEAAVYSFEQAQIFTLHGFCLKILQEFSFETQFFVEESQEEVGRDARLYSYIADFFRTGLTKDFFSKTQMKKVFRKKDIQSLCKEIFSCLEGGKKVRIYPTASSRWKQWNHELSLVANVSKEMLWEEFSLVAPRLAKSAKRKEEADLFFSLIERRESSFEEWDRLLENEEFFLSNIAFTKEEGSGLLRSLQETFVPLYEEALDEDVLFLQLAGACFAHYEKGKEALVSFTPDELVMQLRSCLKKASFRKKVQDKYLVAIIDEFQDTDPLQWDLFETLFLQEPREGFSIYLVGDPKQSIYAFRSADVYTYLKACSLLGEQARAYLDTNFRSHPKLVEALNEFFSFELPPQWMFLPKTDSFLEVRKVQSKPLYPSALDGDELGRLHFFLVEGKASKKKWPTEEMEEDKIFPYLAEEMLRLQKTRGFSLQEMAVLVRDRYQGARLREALQKHGIPCCLPTVFEVEASVAFDVICHVLEACLDPMHLSSLKKFLASALVGCCFEEIEGCWDNPLLQKARCFFLSAPSLIRKRGFGAFMQTLLNSHWHKESLAEELLSREDPQLYFELRQVVQLLLEHAKERIYDAQRLLDFCNDLKSHPQEARELGLISEEEEDQVQVLTLHKSKGLEFAIVFALGLCSRYLGSSPYLYLQKDFLKEVALVKEEPEAFLKQTQEGEAEKLRLLYVALTRAKERVYIPLLIPPEGDLLPEGSGSPLELFFRPIGLSKESLLSYLERLSLRGSISYHKVEMVSCGDSFLRPKVSQWIAPPECKKTFKKGMVLSFSSLAQQVHQEEFFLSPKVKEEKQLPPGAETGTLIHALLEMLCKADVHRLGSIQDTVQHVCKGSCLEGFEEEAFRLIQGAFHIPIQTKHGVFSLRQIASSEMSREMEFLYSWQGSLMKGFIDLIFRWQGRYFILDWKTNVLEGYEEVHIRSCMEQSGYFLQAAIYTEALQKYLALFEQRSFEEVFGGVIYFFLRGGKPFYFAPDLTLLQTIDGLGGPAWTLAKNSSLL